MEEELTDQYYSQDNGSENNDIDGNSDLATTDEEVETSDEAGAATVTTDETRENDGPDDIEEYNGDEESENEVDNNAATIDELVIGETLEPVDLDGVDDDNDDSSNTGDEEIAASDETETTDNATADSEEQEEHDSEDEDDESEDIDDQDSAEIEASATDDNVEPVDQDGVDEDNNDDLDNDGEQEEEVSPTDEAPEDAGTDSADQEEQDNDDNDEAGEGLTEKEDLKPVVEAILFSADEPLPLKKINSIVGKKVPKEDLVEIIGQLREEYETNGKGFQIEEIAGGYQILSRPEYHEWVSKLAKKKKEVKLSHACLETLAVVAYKQPILRAEVESIRGVQSGQMIRTLIEAGLVNVTGRAEVIGRPLLYGTTNKFLHQFGLNSIDSLPKS